jgi:hypothetical protein
LDLTGCELGEAGVDAGRLNTSCAFRTLALSLGALIFSVATWLEKRNADLVQIGANVLRADPEKGTPISAARKWALDLIDAGGVKFSQEAREQRLREQLGFAGYTDYGSSYYSPITPSRRHPPSEPPK